MNTIVRALDAGNPFAYSLIFMILYPPTMIILMAIGEKIIEKIKKRKNKA